MDLNFHGTEDQLEQYALGRLAESDMTVLEEHLLVCAVCLERLDQMQDFSVGMREALIADGVAPGTENTVQRNTLSWWSRFGLPEWLGKPGFALALAGAAVVLAVGLSVTGNTNIAPTASLQLTAMRGAMPYSLPAKEIHLTLIDAPQTGGPFRVEVVDSTGKSQWAGSILATVGGDQLDIRKTLSQGDYFVRLYNPEGALVHEYGFRVRI